MAKRKPAPKRGASRYQPAAKSSSIPGWVWLAAGLAIGGFVVFLMKLEPGKSAIKRAPEQAQAPAAPAKPAEPAGPPKPKYDFYTLLPESEKAVSPDALPKTPETAPATPPADASKPDQAKPQTTLFFLQAGSFRAQADADRVRAQIILLGQDVRVESGKVKDDTWYRVLVGPYSTRDQLTQAQKALASNGFNNLLLQQRQGQ